MRITAVFALVLLALGCRKTVPLDAELALGPSIQVANLEVWPVLAASTHEVEPVLTLAEAQARGAVVISELDDARVGRLAIENKGDTRILACAGTVVTGGKQDRQLGEDIVVDPGTTVSVKVFCVEQSRWTGSDSFQGTSLKASAPVRAAGQYGDDQQRVWDGVEIAQAAAIGSGGSYASVKETSHRRQADAAKIEQHLRSQDGNVVGYAYAIDGDAAGIRTFAHSALLEPRLQGFVRAMCVEAELHVAGLSEFTPPQITQVGVDDRDPELAPSAYVPPADDPLQEASDAYDRGDYERAEAKAREVLDLDPDYETAKELARIAKESRSVADEAQVRERFHAEWRAVLRRLQTSALEHVDTEAALRRVAEIEECALMEERPAGALAQPNLTTRPRKPIDIPTLFRKLNATSEKIVETEGANRNGYRRAEEGNHSACYVKTKDGRWVPLTRDWTRKQN